MKRKLFRWVKILLIIYCLVGIGIYSFQDRLIFRGEAVTKDQAYNFKQSHKEVNIPYTHTSNINIVQFFTDQPVKGVILYFHGNRQNIERYAHFSEILTGNGYEVWMMDYPGYGKSTGELTEKTLYDWALTMYKLSRARFSPDSIIIYGKSLGTGIASQLAAVRDCRRLILETPYYDCPSALGQYLPIYPLRQMIRYEFPVYKHLQQVTAPVSIFHGTSDGVIRYRNANRLRPFLKPEDEFITIEWGSHNDLPTFDLYKEKIDSILKR